MQWTSEEDQCLLELFNEIQVYNRWKEISKKMLNLGFRKSEVECRNRYHNKLNPALSKEKWTNAEVKKLFQSYDEYGSKWNLIQVFLPGRTQNNIKNRFFSTLKNLLRKVLKYFSQFSEKNMRYISSRDITDLYQGKARFKKFKGLFRRILKKIDFEVESKSLDLSIESYKDTLKQLSEIVHQEKEKQVKKSDSQQKIIPNSEKTSDSNCLQEKNEEKSLKSFSFQADNSAPKTTTPSENFFDLSLMNGFYFPQQTPWGNFGYQKPMTSPFIPFQIISPMSQYLNP